jgi:putative ABC transport system permease protein
MKNFLRDLRFGVRMLLKKPGFAAAILFTTGLAVGANTTIFSFANGILLRPLPYRNPEQLVQVRSFSPQRGDDLLNNSPPDFLDWRERNKVFEKLALYVTIDQNMPGENETLPVHVTFVSSDLFQLLGVEPLLGRHFLPQEDQPGGDLRKVILSHHLWQQHFNGDRGVLGRTVKLDTSSYEVVGVMPPEFRFPFRTDVWAPAEAGFNLFGSTSRRWPRTGRGSSVIARLKPGVSLQQAGADMDAVARSLEQTYPQSNTGVRMKLIPLREAEVGTTRPYLLLLLGAVGVVLLIACVNVANLLIVRALDREREFAIRTSLGASRWDIVRQLLAEGLVLSFAGGLFGLGVAFVGVKVLGASIPVDLPFWMRFDIDLRVLAFSFALTLVTGLIFGLVPALQASRLDLNSTLKASGRGLSGGGRQRTRSLLVVAEVMLSLLLLVGSGLLLRSFLLLQQVALGFTPENVLVVYVSPPSDKYKETDSYPPYAPVYNQILERLRALPGVESAGGAGIVPLEKTDPAWRTYAFTVEGQTPEDQLKNPLIKSVFVSPDYFDVMRIPLLRGRKFSDADTLKTEHVTVISESMAKRFWPGQEPLGKRVKFGSFEMRAPWRTVVGVVGDVKYSGLSAGSELAYYHPYNQVESGDLHFVLKTKGEPAALLNPVRREIRAVDQDVAIFSADTMEKIIRNSIWQRRLWGMLFGIFTFLALLLTAVGIYGVISYSVSLRSHEIAIRMALGAQRNGVLRLIVGQGLKLALLGVALGVVAALFVTRLMSSLLYGVESLDAASFVGSALVLTLVAVAACLLPALRASRIDPVKALRNE